MRTLDSERVKNITKLGKGKNSSSNGGRLLGLFNIAPAGHRGDVLASTTERDDVSGRQAFVTPTKDV